MSYTTREVRTTRLRGSKRSQVGEVHGARVVWLEQEIQKELLPIEIGKFPDECKQRGIQERLDSNAFKWTSRVPIVLRGATIPLRFTWTRQAEQGAF